MGKKLNKSYKPALKPIFQNAEFLLLKNASMLDFTKKETNEVDIVVRDGIVEEIGKVKADEFTGVAIELKGKIVVPGMLDLHVHFREPGREDKETLMSGAAAAMAGGFTGVCPMPNTTPATDSREIVEFIQEQFSNHLIDVYPIAAITKGREGKNLVEMAELVDAGVRGFSDDGDSVSNAQVLRRALEYARMFDVPIIEHCEDKSLAAGGIMHEGAVSTRLGMPGLASLAEDIVVARNIMLAKYTDSKIHIAHISTAGAVELVRRAKAEGVKVTSEVTPHHFVLTDESLESYDTNFKMSPPLRSQTDVDAVVEGIKDGTIDVIATDHAPHTEEDKNVEFATAPFGILGLETALGLAVTELVNRRGMSIYDVFSKLCYEPYRILGLPVPGVKAGEHANITIFDLQQEWTVDKHHSKSRSRNTPFHGYTLTGKPWGVINNNFIEFDAEP